MKVRQVGELVRLAMHLSYRLAVLRRLPFKSSKAPYSSAFYKLFTIVYVPLVV